MSNLLSLLIVFLATLAVALAGPVPPTLVVHEKRDLSRNGNWLKRNRAPSSLKTPVRIGLRQNEEALRSAGRWLTEVSHPQSEKYGQHWNQEEIVRAFAPSNASVQVVKGWLYSALGRRNVSTTANKGWLAFDATVQELESLLHAEYYEHDDGERITLSCDKYHLPADIQKHIDYITPGLKGVRFTRTALEKRSKDTHRRGRASRTPLVQSGHTLTTLRMLSTGSQNDTCNVAVTPACLQALYGFEPLPANYSISPNNSLGIFEEGDYYAQQDLDLFFSNFTSYIPNGTHPNVDSIDGGIAPVSVSMAGGESDMDLQVAIPIIWPQSTTIYQNDDTYYALDDPNVISVSNTFLDALDGSYCTYSAYGETGDDPQFDPTYPDSNFPAPYGYNGTRMCGVYQPTNVISISYGQQEADLPAYYLKRQCDEFLKLGLQGVTVVTASGDTGVAGVAGHGSANGCLRNGTVFSPTEPNSCPYVTNVGATKILANRTVCDPEVAANDPAGHPYPKAFSSSGGFSNIFPIPDYQASALTTYFTDHNPPYPFYTNGSYNSSTGLYNRNGRGIPDVAANGDNIAVYVQGQFKLQGGTSASAPIFASLITRINEERISAGKGPVGFINPTLYQHPEVLNDIVEGSNPGCGTDGFAAVEGWDPVTGLGTPNYPKMLDLFMSLP